MAAKPIDPDLSFLADLADHAHKLIDEFISLPSSERERATELLYEIQYVISEFKNLRPPPTFAARKLHLVSPSSVCEICGKPVNLHDADFIQEMTSVYHVTCLEDREPE